MATKQRRKSTAKKKTWKCDDCGAPYRSPQGLGAHKRQTGHMGGTAKSNGKAHGNVAQLVTDALKAVDGEMKQMQRKLDRIRKILDE